MSNFLKFINQFYAFEILLFSAMLYFLGAFIHMGLSPIEWHVITRIILGASLFAFIIFVFIVIDMKGGKK